jgi:NADPH2:quinone reductase
LLALEKLMTKHAAQNKLLKNAQLMRAAAIDRFGPPSVLKIHTLPIPQPGPHEVLIALHSAGVGSWDASVRDGSWKPNGRPKFPLILGIDGAGIVAALGERVRNFRAGDRVYSYAMPNPKGGFYAEYVAVDAKKVARIPKVLDFLQAGAGITTGMTALQGVDDSLHVRRGETVLIFGASGSVGTLAVQLAKWRGARVIATASTRKGVTVLRRLGADVVIDARKKAALEKIRTIAPNGIDAVLALAGGDDLERSLDLVRKGGRVAHPNGVEPAPRARRQFKVKHYDAKTGPQELARFGRAVDGSRLRVPLEAIFPLAKAANAHRRLNQHVVGRIVLRIK